jgi:signal transduction histidine kinase
MNNHQERERRLREVEQLYQQLQADYQHLRELNQLKDQFLMTASHELRTPLTSVQGYLELMAQLQDEFPSDQLRDYLQKAQHSCEALVILLGDLMDTGRLEAEADAQPANLARISLQDMLQNVLHHIEPRLIQEQREVDLHIPSHLHVQANPGQLRQALLNISINALKYSPPSTPLTFSARAAPDSHSAAVIISISDRGRGIAPEHQARVFQPFVRLQRDITSPVQGSGLGLYISHRLVEAMHGKIWIESEGIPGKGTTVHIQLPQA